MDFYVLYLVTFAVVNGFIQGTMLVPGPGHTNLEAIHEDPDWRSANFKKSLEFDCIFPPIMIYFRNRWAFQTQYIITL